MNNKQQQQQGVILHSQYIKCNNMYSLQYC